MASAYILEIWSSPVTRHTAHVHQDVSAGKPGLRAGVTTLIDFWNHWFGLSDYSASLRDFLQGFQTAVTLSWKA